MLFKPWYSFFLLDVLDNINPLSEFNAWEDRTSSCVLRGEDLSADLKDPVTISGKLFYYPAEKKRTKQNVEAMIQPESNLDTF